MFDKINNLLFKENITEHDFKRIKDTQDRLRNLLNFIKNGENIYQIIIYIYQN